MRIALVLNDLRLSGGVNVVLQYASRMATEGNHGVTLLLRESTVYPWASEFTTNVNIVPLESAAKYEWDIAVATYWETLLLLGQVRAQSYVWFCQQYEDRFFPDRNPNISTMQIAGAIPLPVVTEAHWLQDLLQTENPDRTVEVVLNGIDKEFFRPADIDMRVAGNFDVLVEGSLDGLAKNTAMALGGALASTHATLVTHIGDTPFTTDDSRYRFVKSQLLFEQMGAMYQRHHLLVKTPLVEGMFGPPLEAFHCGTPALVTPVTGSEEYIRHMQNSLVVSWSNPEDISRQIDHLATTPSLWQKLSEGALQSAQAWPTWETQAVKFEQALLRVAATSKLTQHDLANLSRTISFGDLMHWLAMRRLSDKKAGPGLTESTLETAPLPTRRKTLAGLARRIHRRTKKAM